VEAYALGKYGISMAEQSERFRALGHVVVIPLAEGARDRAVALLAQEPQFDPGEAWRELLGGPPRIAENAFSWAKHDSGDFVSAEPTPGPGDSDGGDVFSP
jgi:hypothetical protein